MPTRKVYRLYKYRALAGKALEYTARIIRDGYVYYAAPEEFNDPFDCRYCVTVDGLPEGAFQNANPDDVRKHANNFLWKAVNEEFRIFSLAGVSDNLLMWSHYADSHRGICLQLTFQASEDLYRVKYRNQRPQFYLVDAFEQFRDEERFNRHAIEILTTKSRAWRYEKEFRCVDFGKRGETRIPTGSLSAIIFGCEIPEESRETVREWVSESGLKIPFFQAIMRDGAFALDIVQASQ